VTGASASAPGSRSSRAPTPPQPENDSNLSRSPLLVTTGSDAIAAITLAGVWYCPLATAAQPSMPSAAAPVSVRKPRMK